MTAHLLLVEDDANDVFFFEKALAEGGGGIPLRVARSVEEARASLQSPPSPALVVLDLVLHRRSGLEVLEWLRRQPSLKEMPVLVLTSSEDPAALARARELGVDDLRVKPSRLPDLRALMEAIRSRWRECGGGFPRQNSECQPQPPGSGRTSASD